MFFRQMFQHVGSLTPAADNEGPACIAFSTALTHFSQIPAHFRSFPSPPWLSQENKLKVVDPVNLE